MWNFLKKIKNEEFVPPDIWVDLHTHVLFGLDDGAKTIEKSIEMILQAEKIGVTHIVATPHYSNIFNPTVDAIEKNFLLLTEALKKQNSHIKLLPGREINFLMIQIEKFKKDPNMLIKGSKNYALIELSRSLNKTSIIEGFFELMMAGIHPIIAHPERNFLIEREPEFIKELRERDFLMQMDAGSIIGVFGKKTKQTAWWLLQKDLIDIVSSDAHSIKHFEYFKEACNQLTASFGNEYVKKLISDNPLRIIQT